MITQYGGDNPLNDRLKTTVESHQSRKEWGLCISYIVAKVTRAATHDQTIHDA